MRCAIIVLFVAGLSLSPHTLGRCGSLSVDECEDNSEWLMEFSGTWQQEWAGNADNGAHQKFETVVQPRFDLELSSGRSVTAIFQFRADAVGEIGHASVESTVRELYLDAQWGGAYWRLGKQQVVWGQADGIKLLDVVNPQSFREFIFDDFDDSRIPTTMVNAEFPVGEESTLQFLWIPDATFHEVAVPGSPYFLTSSKLVPQAPPGLETIVEAPDKPDDLFEDSDAGGKLSTFVGGWDVTLNYLYHYQDFPVLYQSLEIAHTGVRGAVSPKYERNHMLGGALSNVILPDLTLRAELAHNTDTFHVSTDLGQGGVEATPEFAAVIGLDWHLSAGLFLSGQYFQSTLLEYRDTIVRDESERYVSVVLQQHFLDETLQLNALVLYSLNYRDSWLQVKLKHVLQNNVELWIGANIMNGDRNGPFGQFSDRSHCLLGMEVAF